MCDVPSIGSPKDRLPERSANDVFSWTRNESIRSISYCLGTSRRLSNLEGFDHSLEHGCQSLLAVIEWLGQPWDRPGGGPRSIPVAGQFQHTFDIAIDIISSGFHEAGLTNSRAGTTELVINGRPAKIASVAVISSPAIKLLRVGTIAAWLRA